jgi:predicted GTPase
MAEDEVVSIAVLGVTGAGKSSFARLVSQDSSIVIGHSLKAETRTTTSYRFEHNGTVYEIVDCPGFNDTIRPDEEILEDIQSWLYNADRQGRLLSAVIFLHRISDIRVQGSTSLQFRVLQALCGDDFYENLLLGTTFWGKVDEDEGAAREASLCETRNFFGEMMELGA